MESLAVSVVFSLHFQYSVWLCFLLSPVGVAKVRNPTHTVEAYSKCISVKHNSAEMLVNKFLGSGIKLFTLHTLQMQSALYLA